MRRSLRLVVFLAASGFLGLAAWLIWTGLVVPKGNRLRVEMRQRQGVTEFLVVVANVAELQERFSRQEAADPSRLGPVARAWQQYLATATSDQYPDFKVYDRRELERVTLFHASEGPSPLKELWVAVPDRRISVENYIAMVLICGQSGDYQQTLAVTFSPSAPGQMFARPMPADVDVAELFWDTVRAHNWSQSFEPQPTVWTHVFTIRDTYPEVGVIEPR